MANGIYLVDIIFSKNIVFFSLKIYLPLANSADPNEMPHHAAFHLVHHFLLKYPFRGFRYSKGHNDTALENSVNLIP